MRYRKLPGFIVFLCVCGCSVSAPSDEPPRCGPSIDPKNVVVVDAEKASVDQGIDAITEYAIEQAGPFQLISTSTVRSSTFPYVANEPRWIHAQSSAALKGCDILILVDSEMERLPGDLKPQQYLYFLMGLRSP
jgi:hypothetical protein